MSSLVLNCSTVLVDIMSSGREFQSSITLMAKKFCLIDLLLRCLYSFLECPRVVVSENHLDPYKVCFERDVTAPNTLTSHETIQPDRA